jgi:Domain of unknown function (DUF4394)
MAILSHAYALSNANTLVSFNPATPSVGTSIPVSGLISGQILVGIDVRPTNGVLYGLGVNATGDGATLYTISPVTGVATIVGTSVPVPGLGLPDSSYWFDFNPVVDVIRVTTATGLNFRINPNNGSLAGKDVNIVGGLISGAAYTDNETNATTLYTLDALSDQLMIQGGINGIPSPNGGVQTAVGLVGVDFSALNGFDIPPGVDTPSGSGLALLTTLNSGTTQLYSIDLATGAGTLIGDFLNGITPANGLAILNVPSGADFNVDGRGDILFRHDSGQLYLWEMNGLQIIGEGSPPHAPVTSDWHLQGVADFNGDFSSDFLWRQDGSGQVYLWEMNGQQVLAEGAVQQSPPIGTSRASAISTATARATFSGVRTAAARSISGR